jgi:hypothetical protein
MAVAVERLGDLRALDAGGLDLWGMPPPRVAVLARHAATARADDPAHLAPERRAATLVAFATWARRAPSTTRWTCSTTCCGA